MGRSALPPYSNAHAGSDRRGTYKSSSLSNPEPNQSQLSNEVIKVATEMALAHNMMIRNLNAVYLQCEQVTELKDKEDFILYCQTVVEEIHGHHELEETFFFTRVVEFTGRKDIMDVNIQQHRAFETGLKQFEEYIYKETPESYDGKYITRQLDSFVPFLLPHLTDEIKTLLALEKYDHKQLIDAWAYFDSKILANIKDKHRLLPSALGANDKTFEGGKHNFPPFPSFVPYLVHYIYGRRYRGSWRFSPCTIFGQPKELEFAKDV